LTLLSGRPAWQGCQWQSGGGTTHPPRDPAQWSLSSATEVSFSGVAAAFTVKSDTLISATVPVGATTGFVEVTTRSGALRSNTKFLVKA